MRIRTTLRADAPSQSQQPLGYIVSFAYSLDHKSPPKARRRSIEHIAQIKVKFRLPNSFRKGGTLTFQQPGYSADPNSRGRFLLKHQCQGSFAPTHFHPNSRRVLQPPNNEGGGADPLIVRGGRGGRRAAGLGNPIRIPINLPPSHSIRL